MYNIIKTITLFFRYNFLYCFRLICLIIGVNKMLTKEQKIEMFKSDLKENEDLKKENEDLKNRLKKINDILKSDFIIRIFNRNKINVVLKTIFDIVEEGK